LLDGATFNFALLADSVGGSVESHVEVGRLVFGPPDTADNLTLTFGGVGSIDRSWSCDATLAPACFAYHVTRGNSIQPVSRISYTLAPDGKLTLHPAQDPNAVIEGYVTDDATFLIIPVGGGSLLGVRRP